MRRMQWAMWLWSANPDRRASLSGRRSRERRHIAKPSAGAMPACSATERRIFISSRLNEPAFHNHCHRRLQDSPAAPYATKGFRFTRSQKFSRWNPRTIRYPTSVTKQSPVASGFFRAITATASRNTGMNRFRGAAFKTAMTSSWRMRWLLPSRQVGVMKGNRIPNQVCAKARHFMFSQDASREICAVDFETVVLAHVLGAQAGVVQNRGDVRPRRRGRRP